MLSECLPTTYLSYLRLVSRCCDESDESGASQQESNRHWCEGGGRMASVDWPGLGHLWGG